MSRGDRLRAVYRAIDARAIELLRNRKEIVLTITSSNDRNLFLGLKYNQMC